LTTTWGIKQINLSSSSSFTVVPDKSKLDPGGLGLRNAAETFEKCGATVKA
jgi:hypothetical protein